MKQIKHIVRGVGEIHRNGLKLPEMNRTIVLKSLPNSRMSCYKVIEASQQTINTTEYGGAKMRTRNRLWRPEGKSPKKSGYGNGGDVKILDANETLKEIIEIAKYEGKPQPAPIAPVKFNPRDNNKYRSWRDKIRKRDKSKCVLCGEISWIVVHHIVRWIDNEKLRYHEQNGVCLCSYCHAKHHGEKMQPFPDEITDKLIQYVGGIYNCKQSI